MATGCQDDAQFTSTGLPLKSPSVSALVLTGRCTDPPNRETLGVELLALINDARANVEAPALRPNTRLTQIADFYACRLVEGGFLSHVDPQSGSTMDARATDFGYAFFKFGENLAAGQQTADQAFKEWLASPRHRANILDPYFLEIGIAVKDSGDGVRHWVLEFGLPLVGLTDSTESAAPREPMPSTHAASQPTTQPIAHP